MKKLLLSVAVIATMGFASCGDAEADATDGAAAAGQYDKLAKEAKLEPADVAKAIEIGTQMQACYTCESAPGAYDSEMTDECNPFMAAYGDYCVKAFGTDDYNAEGDGGKQVEGFRTIMFETRGALCKK